MGLIAAASLIWLIIKTGRKPSRITYPCQKAAIANIHIFLLALFAPLLGFGKFKVKPPHILNRRLAKVLLLLVPLLLAFGPFAFESVLFTGDYAPISSGSNYLPVSLDLKSQNALASVNSTDLFFVENASSFKGNMDAAVSTLLRLMENHSLFFFKTLSQPAGLIGKDDVVLIKVNCQWSQRGGTNTDLVKSLIKKIVNHPEGFIGEIVVADNGQGWGSLDWGESNAFDHSQSMQDVVSMFSSYKVSTWLWDPIRWSSGKEYDQDDLRDGYVVNSTQNPITYLRVSYPKFKTKYGTYISFKNGIWNNTAKSYSSEKLKVINVPVLKSHGWYGVTACAKHYMGVVSQDLTNAHYLVGNGAMGTEMVETRFPTLNMLDAIWVNANPIESGNSGPSTSYADASFTNVIGASQDPVALEYWASKYILIPAAIHKNYTAYSSLDPDYALGAYHNYLERSMNEIKKAGYQVTMNETEMNVYVSQPLLVHNLDTDLDYTTVQGAISAPETKNGHTIRVDAGIYYEHVSISKSVNLVGESRDTVVIDGSGTGPVVTLSTNNILVSNFTIRNGGHSWSPSDTCIWAHSLSNILIENNCVTDVSNGIIFINLHNSSIGHNFAEGCGVMGLHFDGGSSNCKMVNNTIINSFQGIVVEKSAGNFIQGNNLVNNNVSMNFYASAGNLVEENNLMNNSVGIVLDACNGPNNFQNNNMTDNGYNLIVWGSSVEAFIQNIDTSNIADNKTIYYIIDSHNLILNPINCPNIGYLALVNCTKVTVENIDLSNDKDGMLMARSTNCSLINITLANARTNITLSGFSSQPLIHGGLAFFKSDNNLMTDSRIINNSVAVCLYQSSGNLFYHNSFVDIDRPVISNFQSPGLPPSGSFSINKWDNGFEGNYWSNYESVDLNQDGIGDTPYIMDLDNSDRYPLMGMFHSYDLFHIDPSCTVTIVSNSTISNFNVGFWIGHPEITWIEFNVAGEDGTVGFCRVCIPHMLINVSNIYVVIDNGLTPVLFHNYTLYDNGTYRWIYFSYEHSKHAVDIVPEFPSLIIMPLFTITTLLVVKVCRRRTHKRKAPCWDITNIYENCFSILIIVFNPNGTPRYL